MRSQFSTRCFRHRQELMKLGGPSSFEALSDVGHDGNRGPSKLIPQPKVFAQMLLLETAIDLGR